MNRRVLQAVFEREEHLVAAVREVRRQGFDVDDVFTPYPVHGLDEAAGLRPTRIGWVCAVVGLFGAAAALAFQEWVSVKSWVLDVGGKPPDSLPAFVPVMFEVGVLTGGLASVFALFWITGLYPGKRAKMPHPGITDDRFVLRVDASRGGLDLPRLRESMGRLSAVEIDEVLASGGGA